MQLDLALCSLRRKRVRQIPEVTVTSNCKTHGKKICIDRVPESSNCRLGESGIVPGNITAEHVQENLNSNINALRANSFVSDASVTTPHLMSNQSGYQMGVGTPRSSQDHVAGPVVNTSGASPAGQDVMISYGDNINSSASFHRKRENQDGQVPPLSSLNKRARPMPVGLEGMQPQRIGPLMDSLSELDWKNTLLQQQAIARGIQYANTGNQKFSRQVFEGVLNQDPGAAPFSAGQQGMRFTPKEEQFDTAKLDGPELSGGRNDMQMDTETSHLDPQQARHQQRLPQHTFMRSNFPQSPWNNLCQQTEKDGRKEEQLQKRKSVQSPRLSSGTLVQSPLSSKSGEFSSGSAGPHFGTVTSATVGVSQKERAAISSVNAVGGTPSMTSSGNDSLQRQHQAQLAAKRRSNSLPKTPAISGVGSPASVSNMSVPPNVTSPSVGTQPSVDKDMLDRFSKIETVTLRYNVNCSILAGEFMHLCDCDNCQLICLSMYLNHLIIACIISSLFSLLANLQKSMTYLMSVNCSFNTQSGQTNMIIIIIIFFRF